MKVALILASSFFVISSLTSLGQSAGSSRSCFDESVKLNSIPKSHLYHKKSKPLVIGHHGNPSKYQENTVDGFKSLIELKADGMEFDTFLTKDNKLVVIHYDNTLTLTSKNHNIWDTTYEELKKLDLPTELKYGGKTYTFDKARKIPLLRDVINAVKDQDLVMYLNIKPGYVRNRSESEMVGQKVAELLTELRVENKVLLASFDPFKILAAKKKNPALVIGTFYKTGMWKDATADGLKSEFGDLPGLNQCVAAAPNGKEFMNFIFKSGAVLKSTKGSFVVMNYELYTDDTFHTFKTNYSSDLSFGAFIIDNLALTDQERKEDEKFLDLLIQNNASCLVTDDVPRLLKKLGRSPTEKPGGNPTAFANKNLPTILVLSPVFSFVWFLC